MSNEVEIFNECIAGEVISVVRAADYAALEAENARMERLVSKWQSLAVSNRKVADDALAQLDAIQAARGEVGEVVVTRNGAGHILAVTRQDGDGRILSVIAESAPPAAQDASALVWALEQLRAVMAGHDSTPEEINALALADAQLQAHGQAQQQAG